MRTWGPLFKEAKVDFYVCGHEHTLQHLELADWSVSFVVAGGGGRRGQADAQGQAGPFSSATYGFASFRFTPEKASVELINSKGKAVHAFTHR